MRSTEKTGIPRVLEALESNDWAQVPAGEDLGLGSDFGDFEVEAARAEVDELTSSSLKKPGSRNQDGDGSDLDPESLDFGFDPEDFTGLRRAILNAGQDDDDEEEGSNNATSGGKGTSTGGGGHDEKLDEDEVQKLEGMMLKLQAVRDMSAGLPEDQRRRMAAKAVGEVMREL